MGHVVDLPDASSPRQTAPPVDERARRPAERARLSASKQKRPGDPPRTCTGWRDENERTPHYKSPSHLPQDTRATIAEQLNARLADGLDLHSQIKVAHWNIKGPQFAALHPLFETFAVSLAAFNDSIAERAVTLGGRAYGTVRQAAKASRLPDYPPDATRDLEHVKLLAERFEKYLDGVRETRSTGEKLNDTDTVDLLTGVITEFEKNAWFLRASLDG